MHGIPTSVGTINSCNVECYLNVQIAFLYLVLFPHSVADWTIPAVTGDIPPPTAEFSFTRISSDTAVMFGGDTTGPVSSELYLATVGSDSVVCA